MGTDVRPADGSQPAPKRVIAHLDCDAFYASVELLRRPEPRDKAVIVAHDGPRSVVTTASYAARRYGVGSAMPLSRAKRLCPHAILVPPDFASYKRVSRELWAIVSGRLGALQHLGLDEAYADLTGVEKPVRVLRELVAEVRGRTGITVSVGIGPSRLVAKICSDLGKPAGFVAMGREEAARRFAGHPPKLLPGIGPKSAERLRELGIETIGQLQRTPLETLTARFGANHGADLLRRAHFHDDSPVETERVLKSRSNERTFDEDVASLAELEEVLRRLARELCEGLRRRGTRGRTIAIKVRLDDWTTVTRARTIDAHTNDTALVTEVALELLRAYAPPRPVRLLGVRLAGFDEEGGGAAAPPRNAAQLALPL
ncbi:DNA polymerase IV [Conexibacter arvalis]|uniref:DNA polymerase IV n=1 Tax=Conexibacter arvalis TaxID=912552 RepID=A0A840IHT3_9ACTN|nr:DNA polymerase-4 [Conexibacter arvalis]